MTFLPIVTRELRAASRRNATYWIRTGSGFSALILGTWFFLVNWNSSPTAMAKNLFGFLTGFSMLLALLSGLRHTADSLSEEKREGTLGLLFLTDLKGYDVVLGKLVASSVNALYCLLALLPLSAVPLLLGGVAGVEVARTSVVALNTLFFSLAVGLWASSCVRSPRHAVSLTLLVVLVISGALPLLGVWASATGKPPWLTQCLHIPSPGFGFAMAFEPMYRSDSRAFWLSLGFVHGLGWLALFVASLVLPRTWQERPAGSRNLRLREWWWRWTRGGTERRSKLRSALLEVNAFLWLSSRMRTRFGVLWIILLTTAAVWVWGFVKYGRDWFDPAAYMLTTVLLTMTFKAWFASEVTRQLAEDRQNGTLELLLTTSLSVRDIIQGQALAMKRLFLAPTLVLLSALLIFFSATMAEDLSSADRDPWAIVWIGTMLMLVADLVALFWVGMWDGLTSANPNRAASTSLGRILVVPWGCLAVLLLVVSLSSMQGRGEPSGHLFLHAWLLFGFGTDLVFSLWARGKLRTQFRAAAARKYVKPVSLWRKLWSRA